MEGEIHVRDERKELGDGLEEVFDLVQEIRTFLSVKEKSYRIGLRARVPVHIFHPRRGMRLAECETERRVPRKLETVLPPILHQCDIRWTSPRHSAIGGHKGLPIDSVFCYGKIKM